MKKIELMDLVTSLEVSKLIYELEYKNDLDNQVKLWKLGAKVGIYYQFDWYHYRGWDNNY